MSTVSDPGISAANLPEVPLTVEGSSVLHQIVRIRWAQWRSETPERRSAVIEEATRLLSGVESVDGGWTGMYSLLGHKGDLLFVHFRRSFEDLGNTEFQLARTALWDYLEPAYSYLSVVELGLYESTGKVYRGLAEQGIEPHSAGVEREDRGDAAAATDRHGAPAVSGDTARASSSASIR